MKKLFKKLLGNTRLYHNLRSVNFNLKQLRLVKQWIDNGLKGRPPHYIKQKVIKAYALNHNIKTLVETGTYQGDMIEAMLDNFEYIYSIELSKEFYRKAKKRFNRYEHVEIIQGDSGKVLKNLKNSIQKPTLFWLDGHYSGGKTAKGGQETPILAELGHIFKMDNDKHVILIDDARCFGTDPSYPRLEELKDYIWSNWEEASIEVEHDIIRVYE